MIVGGGDFGDRGGHLPRQFSSKVTWCRSSRRVPRLAIMLDRARETENIELLTPYVVEEFLPGEGALLGSARLRHAGRA